MGQLIIDHTQGQGLDGRRGRRVEYKTERCQHCDRIIAMLLVSRREDPLHLSAIDIGQATQHGRDLPTTYTHKYRCQRCSSNICRRCAAVMERNGGECPGPLEARIEAAMAACRSIFDPTFCSRHDYGKTSYAGRGAGF